MDETKIRNNEKVIARAYMSPSETKAFNRRITDIVSIFLNIAPDAVDISEIRDIASECGVSEEYAYAEMLAALSGVDSGGRDRTFFRNYFIPMMNKLEVSDFSSDPYFANIKVPFRKKGRWELKTETVKAGEGFICGDFAVTDDGRMIPQMGFFTEDFSYPAVLEDGREWMTLMPNEIVTTRPAVEKAHGKVLTYGLGLGYFAYMASLKDEVTSVTAVELCEDVRTLFEEYLLPQFPHPEKIRVVCDDAFHYARHNANKEGYDFVFADIWHDAGDGRDLYLKMKEYEKYAPDAEYSYWIEDTIKCYLDRDLWQ